MFLLPVPQAAAWLRTAAERVHAADGGADFLQSQYGEYRELFSVLAAPPRIARACVPAQRPLLPCFANIRSSCTATAEVCLRTSCAW